VGGVDTAPPVTSRAWRVGGISATAAVSTLPIYAARGRGSSFLGNDSTKRRQSVRAVMEIVQKPSNLLSGEKFDDE